jgi:hypothetical protein
MHFANATKMIINEPLYKNKNKKIKFNSFQAIIFFYKKAKGPTRNPLSKKGGTRL